MELKYGVLDIGTLSKIDDFIEDSLEDGEWGCSEFFWDSTLKEGVSGVVTMRNVPDKLKIVSYNVLVHMFLPIKIVRFNFMLGIKDLVSLFMMMEVDMVVAYT